MWERIKRLLCRCRSLEVLSEYKILQVCKCNKCGKYWLHNKEENAYVKITKAEAEDLQRHWYKLK